jgi:hypothetical protein
MAGPHSGPEESDERDDPAIVSRSIEPDPESAEYDLLAIVAELEGRAIDELPSLYTSVDHFVERLFEQPPAPEAQMEIEFSYAGYRITLGQNGDVTLVRVKDSATGT